MSSDPQHRFPIYFRPQPVNFLSVEAENRLCFTGDRDNTCSCKKQTQPEIRVFSKEVCTRTGYPRNEGTDALAMPRVVWSRVVTGL